MSEDSEKLAGEATDDQDVEAHRLTSRLTSKNDTGDEGDEVEAHRLTSRLTSKNDTGDEGDEVEAHTMKGRLEA
ncbi:MAG: hypothetical protein ACRDM1_11910 [Gaiellaceae bacterium]